MKTHIFKEETQRDTNTHMQKKMQRRNCRHTVIYRGRFIKVTVCEGWG